MSIDKAGKWWVGSSPEDIKEYLEAYSAPPKVMVRRYSDKPSASAEAKTSSFLQMTTKAVPNEYARFVPQNTSSATVRNSGPNRHQRSGSALSVALRGPTSELALRSTMTGSSLAVPRRTLRCLWHFGLLCRMEGCLCPFQATARTGLRHLALPLRKFQAELHLLLLHRIDQLKQLAPVDHFHERRPRALVAHDVERRRVLKVELLPQFPIGLD